MPGATLGMADYLSRHPTFTAPPPSSVYDELFVIKTIKNFSQACNSIRAGAWTPSAEFIDPTFASHIITGNLNHKQKPDGISTSGVGPREGALSYSLSFDQSESFTKIRHLPVGGDDFVSQFNGVRCSGSSQEGVAGETGDSDQSGLNVVFRNRLPIKWRSLTESINQSCACVQSSFQPREGYEILTEVLSQSEKRCSKSIKPIEGDRTCDHGHSQSDLRFNITLPQGQNKSFSSQFCSFVNSHSVDQLYSDMSSSPINASALLENTATTENLLNFEEKFGSAPDGGQTNNTSAPQ